MSTIKDQKRMVDVFCRQFKSAPWQTMSQWQAKSPVDAPARGGIWISRTKFRAPVETHLRDALYHVCERLKIADQKIIPSQQIPLTDVGVEFIGCRSGVDNNAPEPEISEQDKLQALESEWKGDLTILYVHGGGLFTGSPAEYRAASARLARLTGARVASIRYRLAPTNTFPAPVLDILLAYASLIYPPPGSHHKPVSAKSIVIAGNSAGANLGIALTRVLLEFSRETGQQGPKILFHGQCVQLHLPAGVAVFSGWCDQCDVLPSWYEKGEHDILVQVQPALMPEYPADEIWPSNPPREHPYCAGSTLDHELVSPVAVGDWSGAPPMWFACGTEDRCLDGNRMIASQAARCGVPVLWNEYEGMPHEFAVLLGKLPQSKHCFASCAAACKAFGEGKPISSRSLRMKIPACEDIDLGDVAALAPLPLNEVKRRMRERTRHIPVWTGTRSLKSRI